MTELHKLADFVSGLEFRDLPAEVVEKAQDIALDAWGVQLAASRLPWSKMVYRYVRSQGGTPQSTVVNYGLQTTIGQAALANAAFGHGFEMDDNHAQTAIKGSSVTVPTALAVGEERKSSGVELIVALVAGFEVMVRAALAASSAMMPRGNHPTGTVGAIGAAAITGKLRDLSTHQLTHALGGAAINAVGFAEAPASGRGHVKRLFGALASFNGIRSALLAEQGMIGPDTTLDPGYGFARVYEIDEEKAGALTEGLGSRWEILNVHHKVYAQDGYIQPMTEALEKIRSEHEFDVDDVDGVWVGTNSRAANRIVGLIREPQHLTDAQFSANFSVALFLVKGGASFREYNESNLFDPEVRALSERVTIAVDDEIEEEFQRSRPRGARVVVTLRSGRKLEAKVSNLRHVTPDELRERFMDRASAVLPEAQCRRLLDKSSNLIEVSDVSTVASDLVAAR